MKLVNIYNFLPDGRVDVDDDEEDEDESDMVRQLKKEAIERVERRQQSSLSRPSLIDRRDAAAISCSCCEETKDGRAFCSCSSR